MALIGFIGLSELVGLVSFGLTASGGQGWFLTLAAPPGTPPPWVFGAVWMLLYASVGVAAWLVWRHLDLVPARRYAALQVWGWQLGVNALWAPAFFGLHSPALGLLVLLFLLMLIALTIRRFRPVQPLAGGLLLPYLGWVAYAAYVNAGIIWLNQPGP